MNSKFIRLADFNNEGGDFPEINSISPSLVNSINSSNSLENNSINITNIQSEIESMFLSIILGIYHSAAPFIYNKHKESINEIMNPIIDFFTKTHNIEKPSLEYDDFANFVYIILGFRIEDLNKTWILKLEELRTPEEAMLEAIKLSKAYSSFFIAQIFTYLNS